MTLKWNAQYQQSPTSAEGSIIKREWWKKWPKDELPPLQHVIQSYDTAFMKKETADFSAQARGVSLNSRTADRGLCYWMF